MKAMISCVPLLLAAGCASVPAGDGRAAVLAVDERQRAMVAAADISGLERLAHPNLRINAPGGRILTLAPWRLYAAMATARLALMLALLI